MSQLSPEPVSTEPSHSLSRKKGQARCAYLTEVGRRCRLAVSDARSGLCFRHHSLSQTQVSQADPEVLANDLLGKIEDFSTADDINSFLGNLARQLVRRRISRPDAIALAYIGQLLLNSLPALRREEEAEREDLASQYLMQAFKPEPPNDALTTRAETSLKTGDAASAVRQSF